MRKIQAVLFVTYFCLMMIVLGGAIFAVMVEYPNWFANIPVSLDATRNFYKVLHPGYFFQTTGPLVLLTGFGFVIAGWRIRPARNLVLVSIVTMIAIELLTFLYIYPRLSILFGPNTSQSLEVLGQAASEFTFADRIRTVMDVAASAVSVGALFKFFEARYATKSDLP